MLNGFPIWEARPGDATAQRPRHRECFNDEVADPRRRVGGEMLTFAIEIGLLRHIQHGSSAARSHLAFRRTPRFGPEPSCRNRGGAHFPVCRLAR
jgi:hypothetical protein